MGLFTAKRKVVVVSKSSHYFSTCTSFPSMWTTFNLLTIYLLLLYYYPSVSLTIYAEGSVALTCFPWGWYETVSNTEPINNRFSKLPAPVRAAAAAATFRLESKEKHFFLSSFLFLFFFLLFWLLSMKVYLHACSVLGFVLLIRCFLLTCFGSEVRVTADSQYSLSMSNPRRKTIC